MRETYSLSDEGKDAAIASQVDVWINEAELHGWFLFETKRRSV
jgi:hypothetical protein